MTLELYKQRIQQFAKKNSNDIKLWNYQVDQIAAEIAKIPGVKQKNLEEPFMKIGGPLK